MVSIILINWRPKKKTLLILPCHAYSGTEVGLGHLAVSMKRQASTALGEPASSSSIQLSVRARSSSDRAPRPRLRPVTHSWGSPWVTRRADPPSRPSGSLPTEPVRRVSPPGARLAVWSITRPRADHHRCQSVALKHPGQPRVAIGRVNPHCRLNMHYPRGRESYTQTWFLGRHWFMTMLIGSRLVLMCLHEYIYMSIVQPWARSNKK